VWRQGNACGLRDAADHAFDVGSGDDALAVFLDDGLLQPIEIAQQVLPYGPESLWPGFPTLRKKIASFQYPADAQPV
jgi:hypothetical protein